ncbi:MAG: transcription-repair coupling factor [Deltaproteobacteria bacterium]|nr:transcription-repair coupling factor [Deltaproteobacteria bacterium]
MHRIYEHHAKLTEWMKEGVQELKITGLSGAGRAYFFSRLFVEVEKTCLVVLPTAKDAGRFYKELAFFLPELFVSGDPETRRLYDFPLYDISPLKGLSPHSDIVARRIQALYALSSVLGSVVVTSTEALLLRMVPKEAVVEALEPMEAGEEMDREKLLKKLEACGYQRTSLVEQRGDYSVRGGVIDIYPPLYSNPIRLEFLGDTLESIRHFEPLGQRSLANLMEFVFLPANEIIMGEGNIRRARSMGRLPSLFKEACSFPGQEAWLNHFYPRPGTLFDYLPQKGLLLLMDPLRIRKESKVFVEKFSAEKEKYRKEAEERKRPFPEIKGVVLSPEEMETAFQRFQRIRCGDLFVDSGRHESPASLHITGGFKVDEDLTLKLGGRGRVSMAPLAEKISAWLERGARVVLVCRTEQQAGRLREILHNYEVEVNHMAGCWNDVPSGKGLFICLGRLSEGLSWPSENLIVVSEDEIFGPKRSHSRDGASEGGINWTAFSQLKQGDLVVHQDHGIGRFHGLVKMEIEQKVNDFVIIEYTGNDRLYVPADRISILQKYIGADEKDPKLDQLGGRSWEVAKEKARKSIREIAKHLVELYALRKHRKGHAYSRPDPCYREFEAGFEHEETRDQIKAIEDVLEDMEGDRPMDRLICGDVGFGKTEVAIRAAFKAVMDGKQVAVLVPTTVLAEQHHDTFRKRMSLYPVRIAVLSRFKSRAEQKEIVAGARSGKVDILIGTHRMLQKDVSFRDLGLLIIDEEQRFGVKQKEAIKRYRALVDVLALTATPIPRTFHLSLMGIRDLSLIETPPEDRLPIQTILTPYEEQNIGRAIEFEIQRGGQVFFVHNRVRSIEAMKRDLEKLVPHARLAVAHGQMKEKDLEETMMRFLNKELDVLVCTTIIESGLDIPSVNTIIINEVDRLGLAQIYQLRGRVGRSDENAYAYLLLSPEAELTRDAEKRLKALMDFTHLGAGIQLAMHDLKIRGGGNILGFAQSGHVSAIGYELYLKLIEQSVAELKGEEWQEEINPEINVNLPAHLPTSYIRDTDLRLNLYRRLSNLKEESELTCMAEEMKDRFGSPPEEVKNLLKIMSLRLLLKRLRLLRLDATQNGFTLTFSSDTPVKPETLLRLVKRDPRRYRFLSEHKLRVMLSAGTALTTIDQAKNILRDFQ